MKKIISLLLLGFMMPLGASAEVDTFASTLSLQSSRINMSIDLSEVDKNAPISPAIGNFLLKGEPGEGQSNKYSLYRVGKDKIEKEYSETVSSALLLNQKVQRLTRGFYQVIYEGSLAFVEIKDGETTEVNLERIDIAPKGFDYRVYTDFSSEKQRLKFQRWFWNTSRSPSLLNFCYEYRHRQAAKQFCALFKSNDFDVFSKTVSFSKDSELLILDMSCYNTSTYKCSPVRWYNNGRFNISHTSDSKKKETFVSVLPGAYKIEFSE